MTDPIIASAESQAVAAVLPAFQSNLGDLIANPQADSAIADFLALQGDLVKAVPHLKEILIKSAGTIILQEISKLAAQIAPPAPAAPAA